jgi:hypothetical protein
MQVLAYLIRQRKCNKPTLQKMDTKTKWFFGLGLAAVIGLLLWLILHKGQDLKNAIENIKAASGKLDSLKIKMDSAIAINEKIIKSNSDFKRVIKGIDSVTQKRDKEARIREVKLLKQLDSVTTNISQLKKQLANTSEQLPLPPVQILKTNRQ